MRTTAVLALLFIQVVLAAEPRLSLKSHLSREDFSLNDFITNTVVIRIPVDREAGIFAAGVHCHYPGDPVWKGLTTTGSRFSEKLVMTEQGASLKEYRITWILSPQYAGTVVLKPVSITFFHNGKTNTVLTPVKSFAVREAGSALLVWILAGTGIFFILSVILYRYKRKKRAAGDGPQTSGGSDGE